MEKRTGINTTNQGHEAYVVIRDMEVHAIPVEMQPNKDYTPLQRVVERVRQHIPRKDGKK